MKEKRGPRIWALVIAILLTLVNVRLLIIALVTGASYGFSAELFGEIVGYFFLPTLFYVIAFLPRKNKPQ